VVADVRDEQAVAAALAQAVACHGPLDVLVSGAAGNFLAPAEQMSSNAFKVVVDIDLLGSFHVARQALAHLQQPGRA
jgi:NAD(P)-dependent dehydrogenase (short-subunit alcohol dehydrogenase family)